MHNLADVLETYQPKARTIRDSSLRKDCTELEKQYIEKSMKEASELFLFDRLFSAYIFHTSKIR